MRVTDKRLVVGHDDDSNGKDTVRPLNQANNSDDPMSPTTDNRPTETFTRTATSTLGPSPPTVFLPNLQTTRSQEIRTLLQTSSCPSSVSGQPVQAAMELKVAIWDLADRLGVRCGWTKEATTQLNEGLSRLVTAIRKLPDVSVLDARVAAFEWASVAGPSCVCGARSVETVQTEPTADESGQAELQPQGQGERAADRH